MISPHPQVAPTFWDIAEISSRIPPETRILPLASWGPRDFVHTSSERVRAVQSLVNVPLSSQSGFSRNRLAAIQIPRDRRYAFQRQIQVSAEMNSTHRMQVSLGSDRFWLCRRDCEALLFRYHLISACADRQKRSAKASSASQITFSAAAAAAKLLLLIAQHPSFQILLNVRLLTLSSDI